MFWNCISNEVIFIHFFFFIFYFILFYFFLSKENDFVCWDVIFLSVVFWRKRKSSRQSNISDNVSKFFFHENLIIYVEGGIYFRTTSTRVLCIILFMKGNKYVFLLRCLYNVHWIYKFFTVLMRKYYFGDKHRFIQSISTWFKGSLDYLISHQRGEITEV